jgi:hypothetical protein
MQPGYLEEIRGFPSPPRDGFGIAPVVKTKKAGLHSMQPGCLEEIRGFPSPSRDGFGIV